jgi:hypothetical protein
MSLAPPTLGSRSRFLIKLPIPTLDDPEPTVHRGLPAWPARQAIFLVHPIFRSRPACAGTSHGAQGDLSSSAPRRCHRDDPRSLRGCGARHCLVRDSRSLRWRRPCADEEMPGPLRACRPKGHRPSLCARVVSANRQRGSFPRGSPAVAAQTTGAWHLLESRHASRRSDNAVRDSRQCLAPQPGGRRGSPWRAQEVPGIASVRLAAAVPRQSPDGALTPPAWAASTPVAGSGRCSRRETVPGSPGARPPPPRSHLPVRAR